MSGAATATKARLRAELRRRRVEVDPQTAEAVRDHLGDLVARWPPGLVLAYRALPDEIDLDPLWPHLDRPVAVPRVGAGGRLTFHPWDAPITWGPGGLQEPAPGAPTVDLAGVVAVCCPGLAFDRTGVRLGRGGGHYDRFLLTLGPGVIRLGVTVEARVLDRLPREAHDVAMTHLLTEAGSVAV